MSRNTSSIYQEMAEYNFHNYTRANSIFTMVKVSFGRNTYGWMDRLQIMKIHQRHYL